MRMGVAGAKSGRGVVCRTTDRPTRRPPALAQRHRATDRRPWRVMGLATRRGAGPHRPHRCSRGAAAPQSHYPAAGGIHTKPLSGRRRRAERPLQGAEEVQRANRGAGERGKRRRRAHGGGGVGRRTSGSIGGGGGCPRPPRRGPEPCQHGAVAGALHVPLRVQ
ncbi:hypothetical protein I4F81_004917 [Pyropia yezoensis]|uniref:Uncharacterized protein n=1 Tax=Pyropia yezoensis TaxID=2788 RepID=A0ACC3BWW2_PYRYE|nr:hypothetical protein I4F81_004917 [Neopyropia yezoensis]